MNGIHDLGGMHGFGPVEREEHEPVFHAHWEAVVLAIFEAVRRRGVCSVDEFRHAIERMEPARYLAASYYERWLDGLIRILLEKGAITAEDLDARAAVFAERPDAPATTGMAGPVAPRPRGPAPDTASYVRPGTVPPRFAQGDPVLTRNRQPPGHTRLPRYARGKRGVVARDYGVQVFPDTNAHGQGEAPQPLYCVRFDARELWGDGAASHDAVHLDLWESYLLPL